MLFAVLFEDDPKADRDIRQRHMAAHLAFLERRADRVQAAGPLLGPGGEAAGGLWLVRAEDGRSVQDLVEEDPFWPTGLRKSVRVLHWKQVFSGGKTLPRP